MDDTFSSRWNLCLTCRPKLRTDLHGFTYLIEVLDLTLRSVADENKSMSDQEVELCSEILKILFNLTVSIDRDNMDEVIIITAPFLTKDINLCSDLVVIN